MTAQGTFSIRGRNPDVLTCIANLSNDEVFTPPELASRMLDAVAVSWARDHASADLWADPNVKFLDPFTKSGVFLREITARLTAGLETVIPDLSERVDHILTNQVFGIGVTELTSLLARRSVYCTKWANGEHSIAKSFSTPSGNIWFERTEHTWVGGIPGLITADRKGKPMQTTTGGKCEFCGASQSTLDRGEDLESYAYPFSHTADIKGRVAPMFGGRMQFDVIIGNPPYQLKSDGGTRDIPIYQRFVTQAKALAPRYLCMVIPSRWMASGLGLGQFREEMLNDKGIQTLVDYPVASEVFPGVEVKGGVCYFLWNAAHRGMCDLTTVRGEDSSGPVARDLSEYDVLVRDSVAIPILKKVLSRGEPSINTILAVDKEFGWTSNFDGFHDVEQRGDVPLHYIRKSTRQVGFIQRSEVTKSAHLIDKWKVLVPKAGSDGGQKIPDVVLGKPLIAASPSVCTQSFLFFYADSEQQARSIQSYYATKFFRFLVSLRKITQDATHSTYSWVPVQSWDSEWTDEALFAKYKISKAEQAHIDRMIRNMELNGGTD